VRENREVLVCLIRRQCQTSPLMAPSHHRMGCIFSLKSHRISDACSCRGGNTTAAVAAAAAAAGVESCGAQFASWREFRRRRQTNSRSDDCCRVGADGPCIGKMQTTQVVDVASCAVRRWTSTSRSSAATLSRTTHETVQSHRAYQPRDGTTAE
jgi:hypothetical protein